MTSLADIQQARARVLTRERLIERERVALAAAIRDYNGPLTKTQLAERLGISRGRLYQIMGRAE